MSLATQLTPDQSEQLIFSSLVSGGIPQTLAQLVAAQSGHETAGWTSNVYLTDNNAFGYGYNGTSYKVYAAVEDSAADLVGYLNRRVADGSFPPLDQITTPDQYAALLKQAGYYSDTETNYLNGLENWLNDNLGTVAVVAGGSGLIIVLVLLALAFWKK